MEGQKGTLEEVLDRTYDLYVHGNVSNITVRRYLRGLEVFTEEGIDLLMSMLIEDKAEYTAETEDEEWV